MPKLNDLTWLSVSLVLLLTACGGNAISRPAPVEEAAPAVEVSPPQVVEEVAVDAAEPSVVEEAVVEAEPAVEEGMMEESAAVVDKMEVEKSTMVEEPVAEEQMAAENVETVTGPSSEQLQILNQLDVLGQPPELNNEVWLNSVPLKLADLHGQVVVIEFWTFG